MERPSVTESTPDATRRRATRVFWAMLGIFTAGFLVFGIVGYIASGEVGILILFVLITLMTIFVSLVGKRRLLDKDSR